MTKKIATIALVSLTLGVMADWLFFDKDLGVNLPLYVLLFLAGAAYLGSLHRAQPPRTALWLVPLLLFFAVMIAVRASGMLQFFNFVLVAYLGLLAVRLVMHPERRLQDFNAADYIDRPLPLIGKSIRTGLRQLRHIVASFLSNRQKRAYGPIIRGIALSLPFLVLFAILFSSADPVFRQYTASAFNFHLDGELVARALLILMVATTLTGVYTLLFTTTREQPLTDAKPSRLKDSLGPTESTIILSSVSVLFASFILVQLAYFFSGADTIASTDLSYADYARRGFFELIAVAAIAMALIWALKKSAKHETPLQGQRFKWLSAILIIEVLVIMLSAHIRLSLYEEAYGFTVLRLVSHLFIAWLAVTLLLLLSYIVRQERESQFALRMFINVMAFFVLLNLINPDNLIARQNIHHMEQTNRIDVTYLRDLSEDAVPAVAGLLKSTNPQVRDEAAQALDLMRSKTMRSSGDWQSYNVSRQAALDVYTQL